ncbi:non-ribosomal peptide synthase/polyketide synthase [Paenibacillus dendritiformis]|uniref:non-ribosomal peptide synthase/polyketide synthase n=1 Tax=Paenibacillus dendritiformis TaxID=130049 RepID=UPI0036524A53
MFPLTHAQQRIWYTELLYPNTTTCTLSGTITIRGNINRELLQQAIQLVIQQNEAFRIKIRQKNSEPMQYVDPYVHKAIEFLDFSEYDESHVEEWLNLHNRKPIKLLHSDLYQFVIIKINEEEYRYSFKVHHIVSDGISMNLAINQITENYVKLTEGTLSAGDEKKLYTDYIDTEQDYEKSERYQKDKAYWLEKFQSLPEITGMKSYNPLVTSTAAKRKSLTISSVLYHKLSEFSRQNKISVFIFFLSAMYIYLHKVSNQNDITIGSVYANRTTKKEKETIGMFASTVAGRMSVEPELELLSFLQRVAKEQKTILRHQKYPYNQLIQDLREKHNNKDIQRLFGIAVEYQNIRFLDFDNFSVRSKVEFGGHEGNDCVLHIKEMSNEQQLVLDVHYRTHIFEENEVQQMLQQIIAIAEHMIHRPFEKIVEVSLISEEEKNTILNVFNDTWADYPRDKTIHQLVEEQAERTPDQAAVVYEGSQLTYRELNTKANQFARTLRAEGVRPDQPVGLLAERSLEMIVGLLAILKAGGAYVPMDPEYPEERLGYMLKDSGAKLLLTQSHLQKCESFDGKRLMLDDERMYSAEGANLKPMAGPAHLAYVIYTSGTTGKPKGVMVEHRGLCNLKPLFEDTLHIGDQDHVVQFASLSFDASCWEMFKALFTGATLYIPAKETILDPRLFEDYMNRHRITAAILPPAYAASLTPRKLPGLKTLITGGSASSVDLVQQWQDRVLYVNAYGPTEDSIVTTIWQASAVAPAGKVVPIGRPIPNHRVYIVGANDQLLPVGIAGELCISGVGVARGYLNRPELTEERFVDNPFEPGERMYRTGDLAKWLPDGNIEYLGRIDHQVKIRGYRIELGEVEAQLLKTASVQEAVAIAREDIDGQPYLCAYIVADKEMTAGELRRALSQALPGYMVPSCFVQLEQMPLTPNGKMDRKALPAPDGSMQTGADDVAPRTPVEAQLAQIWQEVLGLPRIGVKDNFFDIGGHSLRATTLVAKMHKEMGIEMPLREVFQYPTIEQMAEVITGKEYHAAITDKEYHAAYKSIPIAEESAYYPVSSAQKRLYILNQLEGGELSYNMPGVLEMEGALDRERLEEAFRQLIRRHETLRTGFELVGGEAVQRVHRDVEFAVEHVRVKEEEANAHLREFMRPFDLRQPPLLRVRLLELQPDRHLLLFDMHHIISDGASMGLFLREFAQLYEGAELPPLRIQYKDYAAWQQGEMQRERMSKQEAYWLEVFGGDIPVLDLPADYARPLVRSFTGNTFHFVIDQQRSEKLRQLAMQTGTTMYMVLLAAYTTLLSKYSGQEDIIVGTPVAGRTHAELPPILGMFVNTLAMRNAPAGEKTFQEYVLEVKENTLSAYENQDYPFEELVSKLDVSRDVSRNPLFDTMFVLQNIEQSEVSIEGLTCKLYPNEHHIAKFDLTFSLTEEAEGIAGSIEYACSLYREETIERMAKHFTQVIDVIVDDPYKKLSLIEIISPEEKAQILETFNDTAADYPRGKTIPQLVEEQAERTPDRAAVVYEGSQLTYRELNTKANRLARTLRAEGVRPDQPVGLLAERSLEMIVGLLAILKAGGAYVPIDPEYPEERIGYMLEDSGAQLLLTQSHLQKGVQKGGSFDGKRLMLDDERMYSAEGANLKPMAGPDHLAYVIYTSGTTGKPKGVMVEHRGLCNLKLLFEDTLHIGEEDNVVQFASLSFDASCWEMFKALFTGATLYIPAKETILDPRLFEDYMNRHRITAALIPPAYAASLTPGNLPSLKTLITGGSASSVALVQQWQDRVLYMNAYGPTEDSIVTTIWPATTVAPAGKLVPIGRPIPNHRVYIVGANDQLLPVGIAGELCISGAGVARGYLNRPELTEERFVDNPFEPGGRMYRTGDLAKWLPDGTIAYLGRIDHQVKIRGYRIELGEVEAELLKIASVQEAVAIARKDGDGQPYLCAYIVADKELTSGELRSALSQALPGYMVPSCFVQLEHMPLTPNGKIDRKALPAPDGSMQTGADHVAPRTAVEAQLAQIWQEVLGLPRVSVKDNFFDIGGHSLRATALVAKLHKEIGIEMQLREVFQYPTLEQMVEVITAKEHQAAYRSIPIAEESAYYPVSSAQKRLYILSQLEGGELSYNMPGVLEMEGDLDRKRLEEAFRQLIRRHETLRTGFELVGGEAVQRVHRDVEFAVEHVQATEEEAQAYLREFMRPFDLRQPPLLRVRLLELQANRHLLLFDMHHIISDGASMGLFLREFAQLYEGAELPPLRIQYKDYAAWQQGEMQRERMSKQEAYWLEVFGGDIPVLDLPADYARPLVRSFTGNTFHFVIDQQRSEKLRQLAMQTGTTMYMVLLAAYTTLLSKYSGQEDIIVGTPVAGRTHAELPPILGMFVNTLAMRNAPAGEKTFQEYVLEVKENTLSAYENQDYPFEELVSKLDVSRDVSRNPLFDTMFVLQNIEQSEVSIEGLTCKLYPNEHHIAKFDLTFSLTEEAEGIAGSIEYACSLYREETIERMAKHFTQVIDVIVDDPYKKLSLIEIISPEEKAQILETFNDTAADYPRGKTIPQLVEEQAERTPDRAAVVYEGSQLTYRELNTKANRLARTLRAEGVRPDQPVGLLAERSLEMIVGLLAILKAGGAYVPIDPEYPEERIGYMLEDSGAQLLLTQSHLQKGVQKGGSFDGKRLMLDDERMYSAEGANLKPMAGPDHLAYVIYTSGTTGKPKGVMVEHRGLCNLKLLFEDTLHIGEEDNVVQFASLSFDASCWEMFKALFTGATLYIPAKETILDPRLFEDYMNRHRITAALIPPAYAASLTPGNLPSLKTLITGGSASSVALVQQWQDRVLYMNAYGPTEDSIVTTIWLASAVAPAENAVAPYGKLVPIGRPIPNHRVYIVGANDQLLPVGIAGELCISGAGVARGYLNRPELTEERFVDNPFEPGGRMYRTGDLAKWLPDGTIAYLGRIDHQVKIRGYRIELGEVEAELLKITSVQEAVAIAREDGDGQPYLCAYIVADKELTSGELRSALSQALPGYMVPSCFVQLEHMPLTPNGKIDRKALPAPDGSMQTGADHVAPRTAVEAQLAQIWQEVLGLPRVSVKDNFFDIGGHSLRATALVAKLHKEIGIEMQLREVFQYPTLEQMVEVITAKEHQAAYRSIPIAEESAYYPVSSAQKRLYILSQLEGGELSYNMPGVLEMEGDLDRKRLEEAFRQLIRRHETLRTGFELVGGEAVQRVHRDVEFAVEHVQATEEEAQAYLREFMRPFDLRQPPLLRVRLLELQANRHLLLFDMHHIISDGASMGLFLREFAQLYEGAELPPLRIQYKDYAAWQQGEMQRERMSKQEAYWLEVFGGDIPVLDLPADYARPLVRSFTGNTFHFVIDQQRSEKLRQLAMQTGTTMYMVLLAAYTTLLSKYSGQEDIIVGTPVAGRTHAELPPILGMFVNTLAMRNAPAGEKTFQEYVLEVKENTLSAYENQDYPFEELVSKLDVSRDVSRNPLFDTMFVLQNIEQSEVSIEGLTCKLYPNEHHIAKFDLTFSLTEEAEGIAGSIEYACSLYREETIERMAKHFTQVIDVIVDDPYKKLSLIEIISPEEKAQILETFNDTAADYPRGKTIPQLVEEQAERTPDRAAVVYEGSQLTYRELNTKANRLARTLRAEGVRPDQPVGLLAERSLEMIVGLLAILKAGGAYVPIDPEYPEERIGYMLEDSGAKLLVTQSHLRKCESFDGKRLMLDDERMYREDGSNLQTGAQPDHLAYVIYTSGTTGKPKGVMVEHRGLCNLKPLFEDTLHIGEEDHVVQFASLSFDASCWEIFKALFNGATLYIPAKETILDPRLFEDYMRRHRITAALLPPAYAASLTPDHLPGLKTLITGGSASSVDLVQQWQDRVLYVNAYGPTEDSIVTTIWPATSVVPVGNAVDTEGNAIAPAGKLVPIGRPIPNHRVYIVGANDQLLPVGIAGELCISGAGVARGYLNRPELTAERFVENPFEPGGRMYRTGDLAKWLPDGTIAYLGRIDHQVKIRGYRIELGEVEAQLLKIASVQEAVAIAREDGDGQPYLCAYIVADKELTSSELRSALSQALPGYMVPSCFVQLEHMPLTPNGKIDRKALPAPDGSMQTGADYVAPRTAVEAQLAQIWQEVLGLPRIGVKDNFFDIGGHSVKVLQLTQKIHAEMEIDIPLRVVFEMPSIEEMAIELLQRKFTKFEQQNGSNIIKLNKNGLMSVFCFPPALGYGIAFSEMAKHLEDHCVVYAIEFIEGNYAHTDMLDQYVDSIISIQEKGPYVFLGYSAGGNLAFEVAKAMEKRGYEVSDIIMVDSMKRKSRKEESAEEIDHQITQLLEVVPEHFEQVLNAPVTRDKVRNKMRAYHMYWNELVNTGVVQANIYGLVAESSPIREAENHDVLLWKQATSKCYVEYELHGQHMEVLVPGFVEENAKVIQRIINEIFETTHLAYRF